jgi:hypothetical protein
MPALDSLVPRGYLRALPPRARTVIREHRRRLLRDVGGRVLDLGGERDHLPLYPASAEVVPTDGEGPFDHVVSIFFLATVADPAAELDRARQRLGADGTFVFLEPVAATGLGWRGQRLMSPMVRAMAGWRPDREVAALLRAADLVIGELIRTPLPRYLWPLHELAEGRAHHRVNGA